MHRRYQAQLAMATLLLACPGLRLRAQQPVTAPPIPQINTTGRGEVRAAPDRATIHFSVETRAATAAAAGAENARRQRAVLDTLRKLGVLDEQMGTLGYQLNPEMSYAEGKAPRVVAYVARNTVRLDVRRLELLGRYIDAALAAGANQVSSLSFQNSRADELRREALAAAVVRAKADAEAMARAAGGSLGSLLELTAASETPPPRPMEMMARAASQDAETPIVPGDLTVATTVTARWAFSPSP